MRTLNNPSAAIENAETFAQEIHDVLIGSATKDEVHSYACSAISREARFHEWARQIASAAEDGRFYNPGIGRRWT